MFNCELCMIFIGYEWCRYGYNLVTMNIIQSSGIAVRPNKCSFSSAGVDLNVM